MIKSGHSLTLCIALPIAFTLATSGCATKKYVAKQVAPVSQKVAGLEKKTDQRIAYLNNKEESDISQVNERISTTDQRVTQVAEATRQAQGTASRAMEEAEGNSSKIEENTTAIGSLTTNVSNALNYQLVETADVTFGFNKSTLTPQAKLVLNELAAKAQSQPRTVIELAGFTDRIGSRNYNLALSRKRAWTVQRYLISQKVPNSAIHVVGMGEEAPPPGLEADLSAINQNPSKGQVDRLARRVQVRLFGAGDITGAAARERQ